MDVALRFGLPVLLILLGAALYLWGRRERAEALSQMGSKGGFGGPPGTLDIGTEVGFGVEGPGPDPAAARPKILGGLVLLAVGALLLLIMAVWQLLD
ncbi:hypothetical protein FNH13_16425 [Ornithinimicrobium ciconiae]|uniref:Uncharacterized protein n=1 Tax=Ornithinimicrobium ciconiae TaxID=2594265 RepID=A0A516GDZ8_9MICO|nr:hypothetical protein [Ornithinimicrobium ciconiae]QDO89725.1 hypothetical protein FNH13_16425 [Ornithinimicrobium ciconiae]